MTAAAVWPIVAVAIVGILVRPFRLPEAVWTTGAAVAIVAFGLLSPAAAWAAMRRGTDVYLFLAGMMLLAEAARRERVFDWLAAHAVAWCGRSASRSFALVYAIGVVVTAFLSNDATAVVLTPAVYAVARRARVDPLPHLYACAMVANAASFVLPISNPANLVVFGAVLPPLGSWLARFALPSLAAILVTFAVLRVVLRARLATEGSAAGQVDPVPLGAGGVAALAGIGATASILIVVSLLGRPLGVPTAAAGAATALVPLVVRRASPLPLLRGVAWSVLPLVAGLFVLVEAVGTTGATRALAAWLVGTSPAVAGAAVALVANLANNLPVGLLVADVAAAAPPPPAMRDTLLIAVDLGPNLAITGSLATILWLHAVRREGEAVRFGDFLRLGALAMPPALAAAIATRLLAG